MLIELKKDSWCENFILFRSGVVVFTPGLVGHPSYTLERTFQLTGDDPGMETEFDTAFLRPITPTDLEGAKSFLRSWQDPSSTAN